MSADSRNKDKSLGWIVSVGVHIMVLFLFFLINAWKAPNPPNPEYGVELNIGFEEEGFGVNQPLTPPAEQAQPDEAEPQPQTVEPEPEPLEEQAIEEDIPDSKQEDSPVKAKPEVKPKPVEPVKENMKEEVKTAPPVETKPKVEEKKPDDRSLYKKSSGQGTQTEKTGDAGRQNDTLTDTSTDGNPGGGGGGAELNLAGWQFDSTPNVPDSKEGGFVIFTITVDENGEVIEVERKDGTFSKTLENICKNEVWKLIFKTDNPAPSPSTTGTITFKIRSN